MSGSIGTYRGRPPPPPTKPVPPPQILEEFNLDINFSWLFKPFSAMFRWLFSTRKLIAENEHLRNENKKLIQRLGNESEYR